MEVTTPDGVKHESFEAAVPSLRAYTLEHTNFSPDHIEGGIIALRHRFERMEREDSLRV